MAKKIQQQNSVMSMGRESANSALKQMQRYSYQNEKQRQEQRQWEAQMSDAKKSELRTNMQAGMAIGSAFSPVVGAVGAGIAYAATTGNAKPFYFPGAEWIPGWGSDGKSSAIGEVFDAFF